MHSHPVIVRREWLFEKICEWERERKKKLDVVSGHLMFEMKLESNKCTTLRSWGYLNILSSCQKPSFLNSDMVRCLSWLSSRGAPDTSRTTNYLLLMYGSRDIPWVDRRLPLVHVSEVGTFHGWICVYPVVLTSQSYIGNSVMTW